MSFPNLPPVTAAFIGGAFDKLFAEHGYNVTIYKANRCPCKAEAFDNYPSCKNCGAVGWFFTNPKQSKLLLFSINTKLEFRPWSEEDTGTVRMSFLDADKPTYMDRILLDEIDSIYSEVLYPFQDNDYGFMARTVYPIKTVEAIYEFDGPDNKLKPIDASLYTIKDSSVIVFNDSLVQDGRNFTIRYRHIPVYHVLDFFRESMVATNRDQSRLMYRANMPLSALARRAHNVSQLNTKFGFIYDNSI